MQEAPGEYICNMCLCVLVYYGGQKLAKIYCTMITKPVFKPGFALACGWHAPGFLKLIQCRHLYVCVCVFVCVSAPEAINN